MDEQAELRLELKRDFRDFLEQDFGLETGQGKYMEQIQHVLRQFPTTKAVRVEVDLQDLADFNQELHDRTMSSPVDCMPAFEDAIEAIMLEQEGANKVCLFVGSQ